MENVYGGVPPEAVSCCEYGLPTTGELRLRGPMSGRLSGVTFRVNVRVICEPAESVAISVKV